MDHVQYLQMIDDQLRESEKLAKDALKKWKTEEARRNSIEQHKKDYIKWVMEGKS